MTTNKMNAVVVTAYGGPEVLKLKQVEKPMPKENEVLVEVHAASASTADSMMRTGKPYIGRLFIGLRKPKHPIPGTGFAGVVVAKGSQVSSFEIGDAVFGETTLGFSTNAEFVCVPENGVILRKPDSVSFTDATTFCDGHLTSYNFLKEIGQLKIGQKVLINGASGSLGTAAVQLAKHMGAEVTAVCSTRNVGLVKSLGADHVVDYTKQDFTALGNSYDLIYDTLGKRSFKACKKVLTPNGQYLSPVMQLSLLWQMMLTTSSKQKAKFAATGLRSADELREMLRQVLELVTEGHLKTIVDRQFPLEKVAEAHTYIAAGHKKGNVVITVKH